MNLTKDFSLEELTRSDYATRKGITEQFSPPENVVKNLQQLAENILQPLENKLTQNAVIIGQQVSVSSGYRCLRVNKGIGGASKSQHLEGEAADITVKGMTTTDLVKFIVVNNLPFDQLIEEFGSWVHVSFSSQNRRQVLQATKQNGKTVYNPYQP